MKVLIISFLFPPTDSIGSQRVGKTAKYLFRRGHELRVLSAKDAPYPLSAVVEIPTSLVAYTPWWSVDSPYRVMMDLSRPFRRATAAKMAERKPSVPSNAVVPSKRRRIAEVVQQLYMDLLHVPDEAVGWYRSALAEGRKIAKEFEPDVIYASAKPVTALLVARKLGREFDIPWVAELRDLWADNHYYLYTETRRKFDHWLERRILSDAAALVTVSEPWANTLRSKYDVPVHCVRNGFDVEDFVRTDAGPPAPATKNKLRLLHSGAMISQRDPTTLFKAIALLGSDREKVEVLFVGAVEDRYRAIIEHAAREVGVDQQIEFLPFVAHRKCVQMQMEADILLMLLWNDPKEAGVYPGKVFEYAGARRPLLVTGYLDGVAVDLVRERQLGLASNNPPAIANQLKTWLAEKEKNGIVAAPSDVQVHDLTREAQALRIEEVLETVVERAKSSTQIGLG